MVGSVDLEADGIDIKSTPQRCDNQGLDLQIIPLLPAPGFRAGDNTSHHTMAQSLCTDNKHYIHTCMASANFFSGIWYLRGHIGRFYIFTIILISDRANKWYPGNKPYLIISKNNNLHSSQIHNRIPIFLLTFFFFLFLFFLAQRGWVCFSTTPYDRKTGSTKFFFHRIWQDLQAGYFWSIYWLGSKTFLS